MFNNYHIFYLLFNIFIDNYYPYINNIFIIPFVHAYVTSFYSNYLLFNDPKKFFNITIYQNHEINNLYTSIPIYTYIYLFFHVKSAIHRGYAETIHAFMLTLMSYICFANNKNHYFIPGLIIETSTIFLHLMYANKHIIFKILFFLSFTFYRGILFPYICYNFINNHYEEILNIYDLHFVYFIILLLSNLLNFYWLGLIIKKLIKLFK